MSISPGFTTAEIREFVQEYHRQPHGQKGSWLAARPVSYDTLTRWRAVARGGARWRAAVYAGDLDR